MKKQYLEVAKIVAPQGLKGELRAQYYCDGAEFFDILDRVFLGKDKQEIKLLSSRPHGNLVVLRLENVNVREDVTPLIGKLLYIDRDDIKLEEGVYFLQDLIGLTVKDADSGKVYGVVDDIYQNGTADVYSIKTPEGKQLMFPAIPEVLISRDIDEGVITIRPLEGLFEDAKS
ncbi:MAG: 16S rRNA processing protein RimM [Eubacterium sp.]|nr:16S rRNA processing protein RimM [Eubacterium sp.]